MDRELRIGVAGGAECDNSTYNEAVEVGAGIAKNGAVLFCGGRLGVMEAAAKGAYEAGGVTIGVLPGSEASDANAFIRFPICTGMGQARNLVFILSTEAVIAVGGEYGTLSEIALALKHRIPVVGLGTQHLISADSVVKQDPLFLEADNAHDAVAKALHLAKQCRGESREITSKDS